jgi:hypothetical protein
MIVSSQPVEENEADEEDVCNKGDRGEPSEFVDRGTDTEFT